MNIHWFQPDRMSIEQFGEENNLELEITETMTGQWWARFRETTVYTPESLQPGETPCDAVRAYADYMSGRQIAIGGPNLRAFCVPKLYVSRPELYEPPE